MGGAGEAVLRPETALAVRWTWVGAGCGFLAVLSYALISAAPLTSAQGLVAACVFGPALVCASTGLYNVLRVHRRTVSLDLGLVAVFPEPPAEAGSIDLGPLIGAWYLIVTVRLAMSTRWVAAHAVQG